MSANRTERNVLFDVRGAAVDEESRAFAASLLKAWGAEPPRFSLSLRGSGNLGSAAPESLIRTAQSRVPNVVLATWPVWPAKSAVPVVLFVGHGADRLKSMNLRTWSARRAPLVLVPSRREKVELQVLRRFARDRVWALDAGPMESIVECALEWMASGDQSPPPLQVEQCCNAPGAL